MNFSTSALFFDRVQKNNVEFHLVLERAVLTSYLPGATSSLSYLMIWLRMICLPLANWTSKLKKLLAHQENLLVPDDRRELVLTVVQELLRRSLLINWSQETMTCHSSNCFSIVWGEGNTPLVTSLPSSCYVTLF